MPKARRRVLAQSEPPNHQPRIGAMADGQLHHPQGGRGDRRQLTPASLRRCCERPGDVLSLSCCGAPAGSCAPLTCDGCAGRDRRLSPGRRTSRGRFPRDGGTAGKGEPVASDITLLVGDGARRMTYAELATVRGISALSAERLVRRHKWPRQTGNDGVVRVLVPLTEARKVVGNRRVSSSGRPPLTSAPDVRDVIREVIREMSSAAPRTSGVISGKTSGRSSALWIAPMRPCGKPLQRMRRPLPICDSASTLRRKAHRPTL